MSDAAQDDEKRLEVSALSGAVSISEGATSADVVDTALAKALVAAALAGRFEVVSQIVKELQARRLAHLGNVVSLDPSCKKGQGQ